jgi:hypothetical protein
MRESVPVAVPVKELEARAKDSMMMMMLEVAA